MRVGLLFTLIAAITAVSCDAVAASGGGDNRIVPGERIGAIRLGMTAAQLLDLMGEPGPGSYKGRDMNVYAWDETHGPAITVATNLNNIVARICTASPNDATAEGVHPRSSMLAVDARLPKPTRYVTHPIGGHEPRTMYWPGMSVDTDLDVTLAGTICVEPMRPK